MNPIHTFSTVRRMFRMLGAALLGTAAAAAADEPKVVAYIPNRLDLPHFAEGIDYGKLTHINVAFENPVNDDGDFSFNEKDQALLVKAHEQHIPVLVSIGGGGVAGNKALLARYFALIAKDKRSGFSKRLAEYVDRHQFDGVDVDLEGPAINQDYGPFIEALSAVLEPGGKLLTAAVARDNGGAQISDSVFAHFNFVNIMAYDATGPWNPNRAGQHSSMDYAKTNVAYWLQRGLAKSKVVLGVPFYGYGFGDDYRKGGYGYNELVGKYPGAENLDQVGNTIWYNGIPTMKAKTKYVLDEGLGGLMIWALNMDLKDERSLLGAIHETLTAK